MTDDRFRHHAYLAEVAMEDVRYVTGKDISYGASWKLSGGRSAWFMLKRKIDRLCEMLKRPEGPPGFEESLTSRADPPSEGLSISQEAYHFLRQCLSSEDIFAKIRQAPSGDDGTVLAEMRDLRRYLLLVESEMMAAGYVAKPGEDQRSIPRRPVAVRPPPFRPSPTGLTAEEVSRVADLTQGDRSRVDETRASGEWDPGTRRGHDGADNDVVTHAGIG